jgi:hypothetical protein
MGDGHGWFVISSAASLREGSCPTIAMSSRENFNFPFRRFPAGHQISHENDRIFHCQMANTKTVPEIIRFCV